MINQEERPVLSFILCSRNDNYMGSPMWRLATAINYLSEQVFALSKENLVEIVVSDWGSKTPISEVIELTEKSIKLCKFLHVPPKLAKKLQKDSPFAEVYALNAAARRCEGDYIARIDQDTIVERSFLVNFFNAHEGKVDYGFKLDRSYMFAARKQIPYSFVKLNPGITEVDHFIKRYRYIMFCEELKYCFWASAVGILMMHRDIWDEVGGYDERLIYYWFMDVDLGTRIIKKHPIVNIGKTFGYDFFHLEHVPPRFKFRHSHRKLNPEWSKSFDKEVINPNGLDWGLVNEDLKLELFCPHSANSSEKAGVDVGKVLTSIYQRRWICTKAALTSGYRWFYYQLKYGYISIKKSLGKPYL